MAPGMTRTTELSTSSMTVIETVSAARVDRERRLEGDAGTQDGRQA